jgi:hypothetical protein
MEGGKWFILRGDTDQRGPTLGQGLLSLHCIVGLDDSLKPMVPPGALARGPPVLLEQSVEHLTRVGGYYNLKGDYLPGSALLPNTTLAY